MSTLILLHLYLAYFYSSFKTHLKHQLLFQATPPPPPEKGTTSPLSLHSTRHVAFPTVLTLFVHISVPHMNSLRAEAVPCHLCVPTA